MRFAKTTATNTVRGIQVPVWIPETTALSRHSSLEEGFLSTTIDSEKRALDDRLVKLALLFNREKEQRRDLGHDSAVFAYACLTDDPLDGVLFNQPGGKAIDYADTDFGIDIEEAPVECREVVALGREDPNGGLYLKVAHCMVRANTDLGETLYLSKLGLGTVVLSTLESMAEYFQTDQVGQPVGLHMRDYRVPAS
jgi:hypothetical protein